MTYYRCLNDLFGYCSDTPEVKEEKIVDGFGNQVCSKDNITCGKYLTHQERTIGLNLEADIPKLQPVPVPASKPESSPQQSF